MPEPMQTEPDAIGRTLWFVTPVYFDIPSFRELRRRILDVVDANLAGAVSRVRFVLVDDSAGRDDEVAEAAAFDDVEIVVPSFNLGHQRAIVFGIRTMRQCIKDDDFVVTLDADGEDRPEDIPRLLAPLLAKESTSREVCAARRTRRHETLGFKAWYLGFRILFRLLTGTIVRTGNFAAYRGVVVRTTLQHPSFDLCYSSTLISLDLPLVYVDCERGTRYAGTSRMNRVRLLQHGLRMLMPFLDQIAVRALLLFSGVFAASVIAAVVVVSVRIFTDNAIPGWATFSLFGLLITSLTSLGSFIVIFATFSQSRAVSLSSLETADPNPRRPA